MSQENVEIVRQVFDAAARRDSASVLALYDPEVEWDNSRSGGEGLMATGVYRGHDGLREWFREWSGPWANLDYRVGELIDGGENVIAAATMTGRGQASRVESRVDAVRGLDDPGGQDRPGCLVSRTRRRPRSRRVAGVAPVS
jgi:ketosteroid isomerase-like protein